MPTLENFVVRVERLAKGFITSLPVIDRPKQYEIRQHLVDAIRSVQDSVPLGALARMIESTEKTEAFLIAINTDIITLLDTVYAVVGFRMKFPDTDGVYQEYWQEVSLEELEEVAQDEGNLASSATPTRIFCIKESATDDKFDLRYYPQSGLITDKTYTYYYIEKASITGTMTLSTVPNLQEMAILEAAYAITLDGKFLQKRDLILKSIQAKYDNKIRLR